jgi:sec-independent protein translocase protein TatC
MATAEVRVLSDKNDDKGDQDPPKGGDGSMTLWEHLEELRGRIVRMALAFLAGGIGSWIYKEKILDWLILPFQQAWARGHHDSKGVLHFSSPTALFIGYIRISAMAGLIVALPIILYQIWAFIAPGLYAREKRYAIPFVVSSVGLFLLGGYFGWAVAFPAAFDFLLNLPSNGNVVATVMLDEYLEFITRMFVAFGATAELPILALFLSVAGLITHRHLIRFFRYFIVVAFVISAVLTPPDPLSQILMAVPLIALYGVSILVSWVITRNRERRKAEETADEQQSEKKDEKKDDEKKDDEKKDGG